MESKASSRLGSSLPVPCVQELAKEPLAAVPPRYRRRDQDPTAVSSSTCSCPIVDMEKLLSGDRSELEKLDSACREWGFFQLTRHGVRWSLVEEVKVQIEGFFNLPMEEKKKLWQEPGDVEGFGQAFVVSEEQKLDWGDMFYLLTLPSHLRKPRLFPNLPLPFREALEVYATELKGLAIKILNLLKTALGMKAEEMRELFEDGFQAMRMNYYPPCPQPEQVFGLAPHSDAVGLTILLQISEIEGLQIKKDGAWVPVKPLPQAFIVNVGDILQIVTNGAYRSVEHRAVVNSGKERLSVATFYNPGLDREMGPAASLIRPEAPAVYKRIGVVEYFKGLFVRKLDGKAYIDVMKIGDQNQSF
ncbi:protein SRG1-like [Diospyros lotus]|uniref:protein SRG1-like n=1 Tax=Diospyros lotus TaxID=55363 RepID=UPI002256B870|nr:protein SRG1-like [Diospyros lotus]